MHSRIVSARLALIVSLAIAAEAAPAQAFPDFFFPDNTTIDYSIDGFGIAGFANESDLGHVPNINGTSPTIHLETGASSLLFFEFFNSSICDVDGVTSVQVSLGGNSTLDLGTGTVLSVDDGSSAPLTIAGGAMKYFQAIQSGSVTITGGKFGPAAPYATFVDGTSQFTFVGSNLSAIDVGMNPFVSSDQNYILNGLLADGTSVTGDIVSVLAGSPVFTIVNVPEPASLSFLGLVGATLLKRRFRNN